jgi:3-deoxy-D-manno-octulosonic-acid transferase
MHWLYSTVLAIALVLAGPYWLFEMLRHGKYRVGLPERLGRVPERLKSGASASPVIWVHAVSVGEVLAISPLVARLREEAAGYRVLVSTTTDSGQSLAGKHFGESSVFYFPLDFATCIRPYLRTLRPVLVIMAETEFWPNFLRLAGRSGAQIAIVNARISDRSWPGYRRFRWLWHRVLRPVDLFLAQSSADARRLAAIGAPPGRIEVSGNLKFDLPLASELPVVARLRASLKQAGAGPVLVCGSTVDEEESVLLDAFKNVLASYPEAVLLLAPRRPERFDQVARQLQQLGMRFWRRSLWQREAIAGGVLLLDSIGELAALYALADVAFVGGSLVPRGGHNILEPAQWGVPILVGNFTENFRDMVGLFNRAGALRVADRARFSGVLMELLSNHAERAELGRRAEETLRSEMGSTAKTLDALRALLGKRSEARIPPLPTLAGQRHWNRK